MENIEDIKKIRAITMAPINKISDALRRSNYDVNAAIALMVKEQPTIAADMAFRHANNNVVYSYVHNNKIGAMIILACETDFVAKNDMFLQLAKDICMHIVSTPITPAWVSKETLPHELYEEWRAEFEREFSNGKKPPHIVAKIVAGKLDKRLNELCLLNQPFVKDDKTTIQQLIASVSATMGEKIEVKKFVRFSA